MKYREMSSFGKYDFVPGAVVRLKDESMFAESTELVVETIRLAARKLTGFARRQFLAQRP